MPLINSHTPAARRTRTAAGGQGSAFGLLLYGAALAGVLCAAPSSASAYVGPGLGLGAIASVFSLIGAVFLGIVGFVWYPIKRLLKSFNRAKTDDE